MLTREDLKRLLIWDALGALGAAAIASFFSRDYLYSLATGFAMVYTIEVFYFLNKFFLRPRIEDLPRVRRVLVEIGTSFGSHLAGGLIGALIVMLLFGRFTILLVLYLVTFSCSSLLSIRCSTSACSIGSSGKRNSRKSASKPWQPKPN